MNVLVVYDLADDGERSRLFRCLEDFGQPVQRSVFECGDLPDARVVELRHRLAQFDLGKDDTIFLYFLCAHCLTTIERIPPSKRGFDEIDYVV